MEATSLDLTSINTIRTLSMDAIQKANSGHPGLPMGCAPMAYVLWQKHMKHSPQNPHWADRDRFVLSAGHGSMLIYSLLHLTGYDLSLDELKNFRQWKSKTPGHPEFHDDGVEATTGPLGQGTANAVGMAMAERYLANHFNRPGHTVVDHYTYALVSDGDLMEGLSAEAASLAGHLGLGKLIYLYDANDISLDGPLSMTFSEDVEKRYESYGWHVQTVTDGDTDLSALDSAITKARDAKDKPSIIVIKTTIGYGSPNKAGSSSAHGSPLGVDEVAKTKEALGWDPGAQFLIPDDVAAHMGAAKDAGAKAEEDWQGRWDAWAKAHPDLAAQWKSAFAGTLPEGWDGDVPSFDAGESVATRSAGGKILNAIAPKVPWLFGGDADLGGSTKTIIKDGGSFEGREGTGRNIHFGVREHAMGSIANGMAYHGGIRPFTATFFCFADYMRPALRLAALNGLPAVYVYTHDSIGLGEDGPTHQPVEHLMSLRCMPNLTVIRPADANETAEAWKAAMQRTTGPTALVFTRQNLPTLDRAQMGAAEGVHKGAYVLSEANGGSPSAVIIATGSEVQLALEAQAKLQQDGIATRVVSMPSWELFDAQDASYKNEVLPSSVTARVAVEAGVSVGWERYTGLQGKVVGVDRYGASAPYEEIYEHFGLTAESVVSAVRSVL